MLKAAIITFIFMTIELIGGIVSNSIAFLSDSFHMGSDLIGFAIAYVALIISDFPATL